jgi:hypothetical protein
MKNGFRDFEVILLFSFFSVFSFTSILIWLMRNGEKKEEEFFGVSARCLWGCSHVHWCYLD